MALTKQTKGKYTVVTFTIGANEAPSKSSVLLLGDFNGWQTNDSTFQMEKKDGIYEKSIKLENGKSYQFRYLSEDKGWFNDYAADAYVSSPYSGIDNSVVDLSELPTTKKPAAKAKKDDLKKIEGIGPKIASILTEKGIGTFAKLAGSSVKNLERILKEAGPRYAMHKPGSWPKQAKLANAGEWDKLKALQDKLDGGK
ncbi:helix-hairpin-helix domain-containing protein [Maribacter ulvicola]|uniref:Helix-hairpin-helix domain-containing protein n=1 Tax=Maribacter ulvicola TaxID=228959 RepID=A0A1N6ZSB1_9FLAO|nr:helix-hairpin-helix domain-containing protein [Maribacter ulvicola]SIR29793.1 Helix-hairpin-helix domain-containing protein [Maribacter ulvicola]